MKKTQMRTLAIVSAALAFGAATPTLATDDKDDKFGAKLSGYNEVHFIAGNAAASPPVAPALRGAISTAAKGRFKAEIDDRTNSIHYELTYEGLESPVTQAHIHFGQHHTVGGIVVWLCGTGLAGTPLAGPAGTPTCPASGTVTGTITAAQVLAVTGQGITAGEFPELVRAIRAGATYANVHSRDNAPGEIRGQLREGGDHRH